MENQIRKLAVALTLSLVTVVPGGAMADAIDGGWCYRGKSLSIDGPKIITPGGKAMTGIYDRHAFTYRIPAPEPGAGENVFMFQQSEEIMNLWQTPADQPDTSASPQVWTRCNHMS